MPEMISPVGNTGIPPLQSLSNLIGIQSGMIGLQQQRQALQTGQYTQAAAQAQSQQDQQRNAELQALAKFTSSAVKDPKYQMPDGSPNIGKFQQDATAVAPVYGAANIGQTTSNFREAVNTRQALQALSTTQNATITDGLKGLANLPGGATKTDILNWKEQVTANNQDPAFHRAIDTALIGMTPDPGGGYSGTAAKMAAVLGGISMQQPGQMDIGPSIQPVTTTTMGPGVGQVSGTQAPIRKGLTPAEQLPHQIGTPGGVRNVTPGGTMSVPGEAGPVPPGGLGINPSAPQAALATTAASGVGGGDSERYSQVSEAGTTAQKGAALADQVSQLAGQVRTGNLSKEWTDRLAVLAQHDPTITARQMLGKYAAQLQTTALAGAPTDTARQQIEAGMPNPNTMDPDAIKEAALYMKGSFRMNQARQAIADKFKQNNGGSVVGVRDVDDAFTRSADPFVFAYKELPQGEARQKFLISHGYTTPDKINALKAQLNQVNHYVGP